MVIYESELGRVEKGILSGFKFTISTGHKVNATPWMKHQMGALNQGLKAAGLDPVKDRHVSAAFWNYFLDLAHSPADGLAHQVEASRPIEEVVAEFVAALK